jgi:hypothetical protein
MARTLIVTDPLTLLAPPGPQTARTLTVAYPLAIEEDTASNTVRLYEAGTGSQSVMIFREVGPLVNDIDELPSPVFGSAQAPAWTQITYV